MLIHLVNKRTLIYIKKWNHILYNKLYNVIKISTQKIYSAFEHCPQHHLIAVHRKQRPN